MTICVGGPSLPPQVFILCLLSNQNFNSCTHTVARLGGRGPTLTFVMCSSARMGAQRPPQKSSMTRETENFAHNVWERNFFSFWEATRRGAVLTLAENEDMRRPRSYWTATSWPWGLGREVPAGGREKRWKNFLWNLWVSIESLFKASPQASPTTGIVKFCGPLNFIFKASGSQVFCYWQPKDF